MGDLVIPISDPCPVNLISKAIASPQLLDRAATTFCVLIQYGAGTTEMALVLCGPRLREAMDKLRSFEVGVCLEWIPMRPIVGDTLLRVARGRKHLGRW